MEYFKHDINASDDDKICDLLANGGYELLGYYWRFIEYLYVRGGKMPKDKIKSVSWSLHFEETKFYTLLYDFDLFVEDEEYIYSKRVLSEYEEFEAVGRRMSEIGKAGGKASAKAKAQAKAQACGKHTVEKNQADGKRMVKHTVSESLTDSQAYAQQKKIKEKKIKENKIKESEENNSHTLAFGKFNNVFLSEQEFEELKRQHPNHYQAKIERLSSYLATSGKTYNNHFAKLLEWLQEDSAEDNEKMRSQRRKASYDIVALENDFGDI